jgi:hypothetical protein
MTPIEFSSKVVTEYVELDRWLQDQGIATGNSEYQRRPLLERVMDLIEVVRTETLDSTEGK